MKDLVPIAEKIAARLIERRQTIAVAESSTGGLISAALLAVPGASAYFLGGAVVYTRQSRELLLGIPASALEGIRPATEAYASLLARTVREKFSALAACWTSELGGLNKFVHTWVYKDLTERARVREASRQAGGPWPPQTGVRPIRQENKLLIPAAFSPVR